MIEPYPMNLIWLDVIEEWGEEELQLLKDTQITEELERYSGLL